MPVQVETETTLDTIACARHAAASALEKKAEEVVAVDLRGISDVADAFVLCNSASPPQTRAIREAVMAGLEELGRPPWHVEGADGDAWVLIDSVDVVVHIFTPSGRQFYGLESLWADAPRLAMPTPAPGSLTPTGHNTE